MYAQFTEHHNNEGNREIKKKYIYILCFTPFLDNRGIKISNFINLTSLNERESSTGL